jgi:hypothetical protein
MLHDNNQHFGEKYPPTIASNAAVLGKRVKIACIQQVWLTDDWVVTQSFMDNLNALVLHAEAL